MEAILGFGFTVVTSMLAWCISEVRRVRSDLLRIVDREKKEVIVAHRRLDILDGTVSEITERRHDSRSAVEKGAAVPRIHHILLHQIYGADK